MKKYTLITGATGGLGQAFVKECALRGDNLILTGSNPNKLEKVYESVKKEFPEITVAIKTCDLSNAKDRKEFFEFLSQNNLYVDFLINNAGYIIEGDFLAHDDEENLKAIQVNCAGTIDFTQKVIRARDKSAPLHIITISSLAGDYPMPHMAIYAGTKSLLTNFMVALREEVKNENIFITTVCPSGIPTTAQMKEAIEAQGFAGKITACSPEYIAKISLRAVKKNKAIVVPKSVNRFIKLISKPLSEKTLARIVGKRWKKSQDKRNKKENKDNAK